MTYPFVNFAIGKALNKEWEDCGTAAKPGALASYGNVGSAISLSSDNFIGIPTRNTYSFSNTADLTSWSMQIVFMIDGGPNNEISWAECYGTDITDYFRLRVSGGLLSIEHSFKVNNTRRTSYHNLGNAAGGNMMTLEIKANEATGELLTYLDGIAADHVVSVAHATTSQFMGVNPGKFYLGNLYSGSMMVAPFDDIDRGNVSIQKFRFAPNVYANFSGTEDSATGIYTATELAVGTHPSAITFDGTYVEVTPAVETDGKSLGGTSLFEISNSEGVLITVPADYYGLSEQGKFSYSYNGSSIINMSFDRTSNTTTSRTVIGFQGGKFAITSSSSNYVSAYFGNSPTSGVSIQDVNIPSNNTSDVTITHNLGSKPIAGIFIDSGGFKHYFSKKTNILKPIHERYDGGDYDWASYCPFILHNATTSQLTFRSRDNFKSAPSRRVNQFRSPGILVPFRDASRQYFIAATQPSILDETEFYGGSPKIAIYEVTTTGLTERASLTVEDHQKHIKDISIINDGTANVKAVIFTKIVAWREDGPGETLASIYNVSGGSWTEVDTERVMWHAWLDDGNGTADTNSRQLLRSKTVKTPNGTFTVCIDTSNPPGGTSGGGTLPPGGGGGGSGPIVTDPLITEIDIDPRERSSRKAHRAFGPSGAGDRPVDFYITSHKHPSDSNLGLTNANRKSRIVLDDAVKSNFTNIELSVVPISGSSYCLVNVYINTSSSGDIMEQFLLDSNGTLTMMGYSGVVLPAEWSAHPGSLAGLVQSSNSTNWVLESSFSNTTATTVMGGLRMSKLSFTGKNVNSSLRLRKEHIGSVDVGGNQTTCDVIEYNGEIWCLSAPMLRSAKQEIEIFKFDPTNGKFNPVHSIPTWAYLSTVLTYGVHGWLNPRFMIHDNKLMIVAAGMGWDAIGDNGDYPIYVFEWKEESGAFVEPNFLSRNTHGIASGTGKLILFGEGGNVNVEPDLPFRSSRIRLPYEPDFFNMIECPWKPIPMVSFYSLQHIGNTHVLDVDFTSKEIIPVMHSSRTSSLTSVMYNDDCYVACFDYDNNKVRFGEYGHYNTDNYRIPFYYNPIGANNQTIPTTTGNYPIVTTFLSVDGKPCCFTSNFSAVNGAPAVVKIDPANDVTPNFTQLSGKTGTVKKAIARKVRISNTIKNVVAAGFTVNVSGGSAVNFAEIDSSASWTGGGFSSTAGGNLIDFDVMWSDSANSNIGAIVTDNGYLQIYNSTSLDSATGPTLSMLPAATTNKYGGAFTKFTQCRVFDDGEDAYVFGFAKETGNGEGPKGHAIVWKWNGSTWTALDHKPYFGYVQLADRPFQYEGDWYFYALGVSNPDYQYPYTESNRDEEQPAMIMKWQKSIESFSSSRFYSEQRPVNITIPRFPNRDGKYKVHPTIGILGDPVRKKGYVGMLNWDANFVTKDEMRWLHSPANIRVETHDDGLVYYADWYAPNSYGNSSFGKGGFDFVFSIGEGDGFANPMPGFTLDPNWVVNEHPFVYNSQTHHYPMAQAHCRQTVSSTEVKDSKIGSWVTAGVRLRGSQYVSWQDPLSFISPLVIPNVNRKANGKLYVEVEFVDSFANFNTHSAFYLEGANAGEKFAVIRNSTNSTWSTSGYTTLESGLSLNGTPKDAVIGLLFDYDDNRLEVYINGVYRSNKALPSYDLRIRGMIKRPQNSDQGGVIINFGRVPFKNAPSGSQAICGPTIGGTYPYNFTNKSVISSIHRRDITTGSDTTLELHDDPGVLFINSSSGSWVGVELEGWDVLFDLDGTNGKRQLSSDVLSKSGNNVTIDQSAWASATTDAQFTALVAKPCYGIHVETIIGSGVPGTREFNATLSKRPSAALILPHSSGNAPYWCFFANNTHYFIRADKNQGHAMTGWETTKPIDFVGTKDGRFKINDVGQTTAPNFNRTGEKTTVILFADIPGMLNVRAKDASLQGMNEGVSLDTNPQFALFAATGPSDATSNEWTYWSNYLWTDGSTNPAGSTNMSSAYRVASGTSWTNLTDGRSHGRLSGGVHYFGDTNNYYPYADGLNTANMMYFGIWFGDGPLIYSPRIDD